MVMVNMGHSNQLSPREFPKTDGATIVLPKQQTPIKIQSDAIATF
jgi:hypothetical protein